MGRYAFDRPYCARYGLVAGIDEVGRGPLAGPVVAAAVIFPSGYVLRGVNDSKKIPHEKRVVLCKAIKKIAVAIGIGIVDVDQIDALNIFHANVLAMRKAWQALSVTPAFSLIDGPSLRWLEIPHEGIISGDSKSALIAAASIVAKVTRDQMMDELHQQYPGYEFHRHKGYGTPLHLERLRALGPSPIHRRSFAPVAACLVTT